MIYVLCQTVCTLGPTFEKLFIGAKVWRKVQKIGVGRKTVYEIDPCCLENVHRKQGKGMFKWSKSALAYGVKLADSNIIEIALQKVVRSNFANQFSIFNALHTFVFIKTRKCILCSVLVCLIQDLY